MMQCFGFTEQKAARVTDGLKMSHVGLRLRPSALQRRPPSMRSHRRSIFSLSYVALRLMHGLPAAAAAAAVVAGAFISPALLSSYPNGSYNYLPCPQTTRQMIILRSNV